MARDESVKIGIEADISAWIRSMKKAGDISEKQMKAIVNGHIKAAEIQKRETRKAANAEIRNARRVAREIQQRTKDKIESFKKFGEAAQGSIGAATGRIFALGEGIAKFAGAAGPVGIAAAAIAGIGLAGVAAFAAVGYASVKAGIAIHGFIMSARQTNEELNKLSKFGMKNPVPPDVIKEIEAYASIWQGVKRTFQEISVFAAGNMASDLKEVGFEILVLMRMVSNWGQGWLKVNSLIKKSLIEGVIATLRFLPDLLQPLSNIPGLGPLSTAANGLQSSISALEQPIRDLLGDGFDHLGELTELITKQSDAYALARAETAGYLVTLKTATALEKADSDNKKKQAEITKKLTELQRAENAAVKERERGMQRLQSATKSAIGQTEGLVSAYDAFVQQAEQANASPIEKIENAVRFQLEKFEKSSVKLREQSDRLSGLIAANAVAGVDTTILEDQREQILARLQQFEEARAEIVRKSTDEIVALRQKEQFATVESGIKTMRALGGFASQLASNAKEGSDAQKSAAMVSFAVTQASAIAEITINTARAVMAAMALGPAGVPQAVMAGTLGAASLAKVIATPGPQFHIGGQIGQRSVKPDEVNIRARSGEGVLTSRGMASIGGAQGLRNANRGGLSGAEMVVVQKFQHRAFGSFSESHIKQTNSPIRKAIKGKKKVGHG